MLLGVSSAAAAGVPEEREPLTGEGGGGEVWLSTALGTDGDAVAGLKLCPDAVGVGVAVAEEPSVLLTALALDVASTAVLAAVPFLPKELGDSSVEALAPVFAVVLAPLTRDEPLSVELLVAVL